MIKTWLTNADKHLFYIINSQLNWPPADNVMLLLRQPLTWVPVYLFFLLFFAINSRRYLLPLVLLTLLTFTLTDFTSASLIKPLVGRLRPCHDPSLSFQVNNLPGCGGLYSMPSSHASNHFGLSAFWFLTIRHIFKRSWYVLWLWAFAVGYAQIYVGVHFPGDILMGALLGISVGSFTFFLFKKWAATIDQSATTTLSV